MSDEQAHSKNFSGIVNKITNIFNKQNSKDDLREYLQDARDNQVIDTEEAAMIAGVLAFSEQRVRDVMLPKSKMVTVSDEMSFEEIIKLVIKTGHSRFPVENDEDDIIGVLLAKDLLTFVQEPVENFKITDLMRPVHHIPESKPLDVMLREFRRKRLHLAIVTNEYGEIAGLVTLEDAIEEIVGEIDDEFDHEEGDNIKKIDNNKYVVNALTEVEDFNSHFNTQLDANAHDTIGGFVLSQFGYIPHIGETTQFSELTFSIKNADDRRILTLIVSR